MSEYDDETPRERERDREAAFQALKATLQRASEQADRGELIDGREVFAEIRRMSQERRKRRGE
jgi:hypothetical protein